MAERAGAIASREPGMTARPGEVVAPEVHRGGATLGPCAGDAARLQGRLDAFRRLDGAPRGYVKKPFVTCDRLREAGEVSDGFVAPAGQIAPPGGSMAN
jgi:hypothetical protein